MLEQTLDPFSQQIDQALQHWCDTNLQQDNICLACRHILLAGGKHIRSRLILLVANAINPQKNVLKSALAIEMLHSASLIADDLPMMDNASFRRGMQAVHLKYGLDTAILASYRLIFHAYDLIAQNAQELNASQKIAPIIQLTSTACIQAAQSQKLDLALSKPSYQEMLEIIEGKTSTLFYISFALGTYLTNPHFDQDDMLVEIAKHLGIAYQILDDLLDQDDNSLNILSVLSIQEAQVKAQKAFDQVIILLKKMGLLTDSMALFFQTMRQKLAC